MSNPAETYENYIVPALFQPWAERLCGRAMPAPGERVLDVACGTGIVARNACPATGPEGVVRGVDPNPQMLAVARTAAAREGHTIEWAEGRAEELPYPDGSMDVVMCQQGAQFFTDRSRGFAEMHRVLNQGGRVATSTWQPLDRHPFFHALHDAMQRHLGTAAASAPFTLSDAAELRSLLTGVGFKDVEIESVSLTAHYPDPERFLAETVDALMAVVVSMLDIDERQLNEGVDAIKGDLREPLQELTSDDHVYLPWHTHIATARSM